MNTPNKQAKPRQTLASLREELAAKDAEIAQLKAQVSRMIDPIMAQPTMVISTYSTQPHVSMFADTLRRLPNNTRIALYARVLGDEVVGMCDQDILALSEELRVVGVLNESVTEENAHMPLGMNSPESLASWLELCSRQLVHIRTPQ